MSQELFISSKAASREISKLSVKQRNLVLEKLASAISKNTELLIQSNAEDLDKMDKANPLYDRLLLNDKRLEGIAGDIRNVCKLTSPVGETIESRILDNGLSLRKIRVPFGVICVIYEARPNVTFDEFFLVLQNWQCLYSETRKRCRQLQ